MATLEDLAQLAADVPVIAGLPLPALAPRPPRCQRSASAGHCAREAAQAKVIKARSTVYKAQGKMEKLQNEHTTRGTKPRGPALG